MNAELNPVLVGGPLDGLDLRTANLNALRQHSNRLVVLMTIRDVPSYDQALGSPARFFDAGLPAAWSVPYDLDERENCWRFTPPARYY